MGRLGSSVGGGCRVEKDGVGGESCEDPGQIMKSFYRLHRGTWHVDVEDTWVILRKMEVVS